MDGQEFTMIDTAGYVNQVKSTKIQKNTLVMCASACHTVHGLMVLNMPNRLVDLQKSTISQAYRRLFGPRSGKGMIIGQQMGYS